MISFPLNSDNWGRLGNKLFQFASCFGISNKYGTRFCIPEWKYAKYFNISVPQLKSIPIDEIIKEPHFKYAGDFFETWAYHLKVKSVQITGWLQSEKYWRHCKDEIRQQLSFKPFIIDSIKSKFKEALSKPTISISFRVDDDYINNGNYNILPVNYQLTALFKYFPDWRNYNIIVFADDIDYAKVHFSCLSNVYFASGSDIEQLALGSLCDNFILSNSTFSWWQAYLGEKEHSFIIRPNYHFAGDLFKKNSFEDYYPERWICYDHFDSIGEMKKIDLKDVTFMIPVSYDHNDRKENLDLCIAYLKKHFYTNIIISEQGGNHFEYHYPHCDYVHFSSNVFHRTRMLNGMAKLANTQYIFNYDCDVFISPLQILEAVNKLRTGELDMVYPYDGRFARVPRSFYPMLSKWLDVGFFKNSVFKGMLEGDFPSVGGAVAFNKQKYFEAGGENEFMISYSPEDLERKERFDRLGYKVGRVQGTLWHLDHFVGVNSSSKNPFFSDAYKEFNKIKSMTRDELKNYVHSWEWYQK